MMIVQFKGMALIFQTYFNMSYFWAMVINGVLVAAFTAVGGYFAVAWLDTIQGIIMTIGMAIILPVALYAVGGLTGLNNSLRTINPMLVAGRGFMPTQLFWGLMLVFFVSFWGQPHLAVRFYTLKNTKAVKTAFPITMALVTFWLLSGGLCGLAAKVLLPKLANSDLAMPALIQQLLPISGIIVQLALFSAAFSTIDSLLLSVGTSFAHDVYKGYINKGLTEKHELVLSKVFTGVICVIAFLFALNPPNLITVLNGFAFGAFAIVLGFPLLAGAFFKKANKYLAYTAVLLGPAVYIIWKLFFAKSTGIPEMVAAIVVVVPVMIVVNVFTKKPEEKLVKQMF
jgi:Na+/proline symporter